MPQEGAGEHLRGLTVLRPCCTINLVFLLESSVVLVPPVSPTPPPDTARCPQGHVKFLQPYRAPPRVWAELSVFAQNFELYQVTAAAWARDRNPAALAECVEYKRRVLRVLSRAGG